MQQIVGEPMSKFRMKFKLQGLEVEIEGQREDVSLIGRAVGDQVASMLEPAVNVADGERPTPQMINVSPPSADGAKRGGKRRARAAAAAVTNNAGDAQQIDFRHDPMKFGTPSQQWITSQKATWLLYVLKETTGVSELTTGQIVKLFNTHFRQAKTVTSSNVSRDLGRLKIASPSQVGEDNSKTPATWYLTEEGVRQVQNLIAQSLTPRAAA
jgi:hypothetical protein